MSNNRGVGEIEAGGNFTDPEAFGEEVQNLMLKGRQPLSQTEEDVARADERQDGVARNQFFGAGLQGLRRFGRRMAGLRTLGGIDAAAITQIILQEKAAALEVPAISLARTLFFAQPEMDQRLR